MTESEKKIIETETNLKHFSKRQDELLDKVDSLMASMDDIKTLAASITKFNSHILHENHDKQVVESMKKFLYSTEGKEIIKTMNLKTMDSDEAKILLKKFFTNKYEVVFYRWIIAVTTTASLGYFMKDFIKGLIK